ncbi:MAG: YfhO family protein, partial [Lachnospiraceae bacterium]
FSLPGAVLGLASLLGGYGWVILRVNPAEGLTRILIISHPVIGAAMLALLFVASKKERKDRFLSARRIAIFLSVLLAANVTAEVTANLRNRVALRRGGNQMSILQDPDTLAAIAKVQSKDDGWYRIEKLHGAMDSMDASCQGYRAVSNYCSTMNANVLGFVENEWPGLFLWDHNHVTYRTKNYDAGLSRLLGVKYLIVKDGSIDTYNTNLIEGTGAVPAEFEKIETCGSVDIYQDPEVEGIFSFYAGEAAKAVRFDERNREAAFVFLDTKREDAVTAKVSLPSDGLLFAALPYETGWSALVDGEKTEIVKVHNGFSGLWMKAGEHEVRFVYDCPGFRTGALVSLCSLAVFVLLLVVFRLREKRQS